MQINRSAGIESEQYKHVIIKKQKQKDINQKNKPTKPKKRSNYTTLPEASVNPESSGVCCLLMRWFGFLLLQSDRCNPRRLWPCRSASKWPEHNETPKRVGTWGGPNYSLSLSLSLYIYIHTCVYVGILYIYIHIYTCVGESSRNLRPTTIMLQAQMFEFAPGAVQALSCKLLIENTSRLRECQSGISKTL